VSTAAPFDPPTGADAGYAVFAKDRATRVDDGTRIAWTVLEPAPDARPRTPVLAVNGWSCSDAYWVHVAPALVALGHPVVLVDARGHGASGLPRHPGRGARALEPGDITIGRLARDLRAVLDEADVDRAVVMGHSMGVQVGLEVDRLVPDRVAGLVLIAGSYENPLKTFMGLPLADLVFPVGKAAVLSTPAPVLRLAMAPARASALAAWLARQARAAGPKAATDDMAPYLRHIASADTAVMIRTLDAMRRHSAADHLRHVRAPALVLAAGRDTFTPPRCSARMFERIPTAEIHWFPEAHHTLPIEEPEEIVAAIDEWYGRRVTPREGADEAAEGAR
jgi:pimeloyl-ACP methyl ester carboxylesterase